MKITSKILSIPPYISTSWINISSLCLKKKGTKMVLQVTLHDGSATEIPKLSEAEMDAIFEAHVKFAGHENPTPSELPGNILSLSLPFKQEGPILESLGTNLAHNPDQADLPPIPPHILNKIAAVMKTFGLEDASILGEPETDCNCIYCQFVRSFQSSADTASTEEIIEPEDLAFRDWEISQKEDHLYHVVNPLDSNEYYDVFLGEPIGCTCGEKNCEHIKAVLKT